MLQPNPDHIPWVCAFLNNGSGNVDSVVAELKCLAERHPYGPYSYGHPYGGGSTVL